jgi:putative nucleotidyltransferase with HDIG domain
MPNAKKRVLFVDDEPKVLDGLQRMLRKMRDEWDMEFTTSGAEALEAIDKQPFDVVVSDMRMPGMDGAELLTKVREICPTAVRLILSGHSDKEMILKSVGPTHQFLAKPCDPDALKATVARACALRELLANEQLKGVVSGIKSLPSIPGMYTQLVEVLQSPDSSLQDVARIISSDIGMTAKILQLVNSAFFGLRRHIESPAQAITYMGLDTVSAVVLTAGAFAEFAHSHEATKVAEALYPHSIATGNLAGRIAKTVSSDKKLIDDAIMAGMLHDVGKLVLASALPDVWREAVRTATERHVPMDEAERAISGVSHAELGAYLLGLWGLPDTIVEAVVFHHRPSKSLSQGFSVLTAVHVANALLGADELEPGAATVTPVDTAYLEHAGVADRLPEWRQLAAGMREEETADAGTES